MIENMNLKSGSMAIYDLIKLIFLILFMGHITGCAFYLLAKLENNLEDTWVTKFGFND
jgi:hypothetical protein